MMQDLVGIVRNDRDMTDALGKLQELKARADRTGVTGHREYHSGWHTALDLRNLLTVSEAIARSAIERRESRGGHFREDYPAQDKSWSTVNVQVTRAADGRMTVRRVPIPEMPEHLKQVIAEMK
jgi:succinate dehydrogenase flavoprotein subunit